MVKDRRKLLPTKHIPKVPLQTVLVKVLANYLILERLSTKLANYLILARLSTSVANYLSIERLANYLIIARFFPLKIPATRRL